VLAANRAADQTALACIRVTSNAGNTTSSTLKHMAKGTLATSSTAMLGARLGPWSCFGSTAVTLVDSASPPATRNARAVMVMRPFRTFPPPATAIIASSAPAPSPALRTDRVIASAASRSRPCLSAATTAACAAGKD
jgi:hypothetical protein